MDAVYYFMVDVGPVLAPAVLGGCWYAVTMGLISAGTDAGTAAAG